MDIALNKKHRLAAGIVTAVLLIISVIDGRTFFNSGSQVSLIVPMYLLCIAIPFMCGALILYDFEIKNEKISIIINTALILLMPILTITMTECLNGIFVYDMTYLGFAGNYVVCIVFYSIVYICSGSIRLPVFIINPLLFLFATANYYIKLFRGTPFVPMDFANIATGANVANEYSYKINYQVLISFMLLALSIVIAIKLNSPKMLIKGKLITRSALLLLVVSILLSFYLTNFFSNLGVRPDFWNQTRGYKRYGFVCSFFINTKYLFVTTPLGYNPADVDNILESKIDIGGSGEVLSDNCEVPNIICIMNESLSDLKSLGDLETNIDYMPFMNSLKKDTIKGNLYVPVIGAGTSNTEYEFLTGNTTAFFPGGSNAYMLYVKNTAASLVSTLKSQNYNGVAFHPYYSSGWNRVSVYNYFGFSLFKSLGNIMDLSIMSAYQASNDIEQLQQMVEAAYPDSNMLLRSYISDSYDYNVLIEDYENRDVHTPYFVFNVTMQNHGSYNKVCSNFNEDVYPTNLSKSYPMASQYLSLVKKSDEAFKELIEYFSNVDEPVIICMFGDHQPSIENEFVEELLGKSVSSLSNEQEQSRHITPFFIWANYDIPEQQIDKISANYLSSVLLKTAGLHMTDYNKYLLKLFNTIPVIDTVGYIDKDNNYYSWNETSQYSQLLKEYEYIQYNNVFDNKDKKENLFYIKK